MDVAIDYIRFCIHFVSRTSSLARFARSPSKSKSKSKHAMCTQFFPLTGILTIANVTGSRSDTSECSVSASVSASVVSPEVLLVCALVCALVLVLVFDLERDDDGEKCRFQVGFWEFQNH